MYANTRHVCVYMNACMSICMSMYIYMCVRSTYICACVCKLGMGVFVWIPCMYVSIYTYTIQYNTIEHLYRALTKTSLARERVMLHS